MTVAVTNQKDPAQIKAALKQISAISSLPEVTTKIIAVVEDPRSTAKQLHQLVMHDPSLVARVLKVVNSSFYGLPGQVASVDRAIVMLGLNAIKNIAVAAGLGALFKGGALYEGFTPAGLWRHCVIVGMTARTLAKRMQLPTAEEAYLAGMIHDIGLLVSLQVWPDQLRMTCNEARRNGGSFIDLERRIVGADHEQLGTGLLEIWKFPKSCVVAAGFHHRPQQAPEALRQLAGLVYVADTLAAQSEGGFALTAAHQPIDAETLQQLAISPEAVEQVQSEMGDIAVMAETSIMS